MKLPRLLLLRIRRSIRRQLMSPATLSGLRWPANRPDPQPPEPPRKNRMKIAFILLLVAIVALTVFGLTGCGTGTTVKFGQNGIEIVPPAGPIVIPTK